MLINSSIVLNAFDLLSDNDIVFGPARDGGYYLVGLKTPIREIFQDIQWSTSLTLKESLDKASNKGYEVAFTEMLSDIDTIDDLKRVGVLP